MSNIVIDALNYYFEKLRRFALNKKAISHGTEIIDLLPIITIDDETMKYNMIGLYHKINKTFTWAWHLNISKRNYIKTKKLLIYSLDTPSETLQDAYVRRLLTSSVITHVNDDTLTLILALATYLTKSDAIIVDDDNSKTTTYASCFDLKNKS